MKGAWPTALGNERRAPYEHERVPEALNVVWDSDAGSGMRGSMLLTDSVVFIATTNRQLFAFGTADGRKYWDQRFEGEIPGEIVRSGRVLFFATSEWNGRVHARDVERGRVVWRREIGRNTAGPIVDGGIVYTGNDAGYLYAFRSEDGSQVWRTHLFGSIAAVPVSHGNDVIVATTRDTLYRVAKKDGAILMRAHVSSPAAPPALLGDTLVLATHSGLLIGLNAITLQPIWRVDTGAPITAAPIISSNGVLHALNRNADLWRVTGGDGHRIASLGGAVASSFALGLDRYVVGKLDGTLQVVDMNGNVIAEHKFNDSVAAPVGIADAAVYVPLRRGRLVKLQ